MEPIKDSNRVLRALMDTFDTISVYFEKNVSHNEAGQISFFRENKIADYTIKYIHDMHLVINVAPMDIKKMYYIAYDTAKLYVIPHGVLDCRQFHYTGTDLGATYCPDHTVFKVFAPTSTRIQVNIYETINGSGKQTYPLAEAQYGVWSATVPGDLNGKYYAFNVYGALPEFRGDIDVVDPYAKCVIGKTNKALIVDTESFSETVPYPETFHNHRAVIYELHVRDISIDSSSGVQLHGKYGAFAEGDTFLNGDRATGVATVMSHIKELGVNTVQIMPLQDFDNDEADSDFYAWGYMPRFFNAPDGTYATDWTNSSKIEEVRQMVAAFHKNNIRVVLDVVYNHTSEGFFGEGVYSFNSFVPYYYYRFGNGYISNGSGCGNELRTEGHMVKKFIIDSLIFWATFYDFDGFRFDLMGLIDVDTMTDLVNELKMYKPDIFIYGEPWTGGLTPIQPTYKGMQRHKGFGVFNDDFRDALKGAVFNQHEKGYVQTKGYLHHERVIQGILGSINTFAADPSEALNYIEVHDNNTLFDKLYYSLSGHNYFVEPKDDLLERIKKMHMLAGFIILTSQGIPVLHLGQDFMRTKSGIGNSYNSGDRINAIKWERKHEFADVFHYYQHLIDIRLTNHLFTIPREAEVRHAIEFRGDIFHGEHAHAIAYTLDAHEKFYYGASKLMVIINPYVTYIKVTLKEDGWKKLLYETNYFKNELQYADKHFEVPALSGTILTM